MDEKKKRCAKCKKWLPLSEYHINKQNKDGLHSFCKSCRRGYFKPRKKKQVYEYKDILARVQNEI